MITEDYVSFEVAKLLKEKGFDDYDDCECHMFYSSYSKMIMSITEIGLVSDFDEVYYAPTHQMAMKWLRETYDIFIVIRRGLTGTGWVYSHEIYKDSQCLYARYGASYDTYEEAVEAALKYCLENLI